MIVINHQEEVDRAVPLRLPDAAQDAPGAERP